MHSLQNRRHTDTCKHRPCVSVAPAGPPFPCPLPYSSSSITSLSIPQSEVEEECCLLSLLEPMHPMVFSQRPWTRAWKCCPDAEHSPPSSCDSLLLSACSLFSSLPRSLCPFLSLTLFLLCACSIPLSFTPAAPLRLQCGVLEEIRLVSQYAWRGGREGGRGNGTGLKMQGSVKNVQNTLVTFEHEDHAQFECLQVFT